MLNEGRIICPGCILEYNKVNQTKAKPEHILDRHELMKVLPREDSERIFITLKYIATQSEICKATEQKMERVCQKIESYHHQQQGFHHALELFHAIAYMIPEMKHLCS